MDRKAQVKFGESIGVIIVVYILLMIGSIWYSKINNADLNDIIEEDQKNKAFEKYYYFVNYPYVHESKMGIIDGGRYDLLSLRVFANYSDSGMGRGMLKEQLGHSLISIKIFNRTNFNLVDFEEEITLYNYSYNMTTNKYKSIKKNPYRTIVSVYDPVNRQNKIGLLVLTDFVAKEY